LSEEGISGYPALRRALTARRHELVQSQREVDDIARVPDGYTSRVEAGIRNFGDVSLQAILGALGVEIVIRPKEQRSSL
jgi:hypothetical protein